MPHLRTQIRSAVVSALATTSVTADRVFPTRLYSLLESEVPCILVFTNQEDIERLTVHSPVVLQRDLDVFVRLVVAKTSKIDDELDDLIAEVEVLLGATTLSGLVEEFYIELITEPEFDDEGERVVAQVDMHYKAVYSTVSNNPTENL